MNWLKFDRLPTLSYPTPKSFRASCIHQRYSFPDPIMRILWKYYLYSSSERYKKWIKCCKSFYLRNQILFIGNLQYLGWNLWVFCLGDECFSEKCYHKLVNLSHISCKIWLDTKNSIHRAFINLRYPRNLFQKIHGCVTLNLYNCIISYNEWKLLSSENCFFSEITVISVKKSSDLSLHLIAHQFRECNDFVFVFNKNYSNVKCQNFIDLIDYCSTMKTFKLMQIPDIFDLERFYNVLKRSTCNTSIRLQFRSPISDALLYRINRIMDKIIHTKNFAYFPPSFDFRGCSTEKSDKIAEIQKRLLKKETSMA